MDLNKLYYFHIAAKHEHITRASEELRIAQPALSKAIKLLEAELGVALLERNGRRVQLTAAGQYVKKRLDEAFDIISNMPDELNGLKEETCVRLNVQIGSLLVTEAVMEYRKSNADVVFQLLQSGSTEKADIIVAEGTLLAGQKLGKERSCITEEVFLAVPEDFNISAENEIDLASMRKEGFIALSEARPFRSVCDRVCLQSGFRPRITFESDSPAAVRNLISAGTGIGFWPAFSFGKASEQMKLLSIRPTCKRQIVVALNDEATNPCREFYSFLVGYINKKREDSK